MIILAVLKFTQVLIKIKLNINIIFEISTKQQPVKINVKQKILGDPVYWLFPKKKIVHY
jgi:hypothetical protein